VLDALVGAATPYTDAGPLLNLDALSRPARAARVPRADAAQPRKWHEF